MARRFITEREWDTWRLWYRDEQEYDAHSRVQSQPDDGQSLGKWTIEATHGQSRDYGKHKSKRGMI